MNKCVFGFSRTATNREESAEEVPPLDIRVCLQALNPVDEVTHRQGESQVPLINISKGNFQRKKEIGLIF